MKKQLTELLTRYGPIDLLWIDQYANPYTAAQWPEFRSLVSSLQPRCLLLANNSHDFKETDIVGYEFPWRHELPAQTNTSPSEVCDTIQPGQRWFWNKDARLADLPAAAEFAARLRLCNARLANYLLNVPPNTDGLIAGPQLERLRELGRLVSKP